MAKGLVMMCQNQFITLPVFGGNFIVVDEEHDLVIVTRWLDPRKIGEMVKLVIDAVE